MNCLAEVIGPDFRTSARDIHVLNHRAIALVHNKHFYIHRLLLCSPRWPGTHFADLTGPELTEDPPAPASQVLPLDA